jgi:hypothetical protein
VLGKERRAEDYRVWLLLFLFLAALSAFALLEALKEGGHILHLVPYEAADINR